MKKYLKDKNFYFVLAPVAAGLWALLAAFVFYPKSVQAYQDGKAEYLAAQDYIEKLVTLQPKRLAYKVDTGDAPDSFDFTKNVNEFAQIFKISDSNFNLNVRTEVKRAGRKTRSATMSIKTIDIERLASFMSAMLLRWPQLQCEVLSLQKAKNAKNDWKVELQMTYYY